MTPQQSARLACFARMGYERVSHSRSRRTGNVYAYLRAKLSDAVLFLTVLDDGMYTGKLIK